MIKKCPGHPADGPRPSRLGPPAAATGRPTDAERRIIGVDAARGVALFGMMAVHVFDTFTPDGRLSAATILAGGRSAATFVFVAGISLAFLSGGRAPARGRRRAAAAAGIAVRGLLVGLIGLALGLLPDPPADIILQYYALMFLLSIPLLGLSPKALGWLSAGIVVVGPVVLYALSELDLPFSGQDSDPGTLDVLRHPVGFVVLLLVTGTYPVTAYLGYLCAGMAVGRLDLTSHRVAGRLLGGGLALAVTAKLASWVLLGPVGGLAQVAAMSGASSTAERSELLWGEDHLAGSWWSLALTTPHSNTPLDLAHTLGSAMAVLGAMLLLTGAWPRSPVLGTVATAGRMTLTLYTAHLLVLWAGLLDDEPTVLYLLMVVAANVFALAWRRGHAQGPLERPLAAAAGKVRRAITETSRDHTDLA